MCKLSRYLTWQRRLSRSATRRLQLSVRDTKRSHDQRLKTPQQVREALEQSERDLRTLTEQLEEERARLVAVQSVAKVGSWHTDLATQVVTWSAETYRIFETTPADFNQTHEAFLRHVHPDDRAYVDHALMQSLGRRTASSVEHRVLLANDRVKFVEERWLVAHDHDGQPTQATGTCRDITEQKLAERRIQQLNRVYAVLSLHADVVIDKGDAGLQMLPALRMFQ